MEKILVLQIWAKTSHEISDVDILSSPQLTPNKHGSWEGYQRERFRIHIFWLFLGIKCRMFSIFHFCRVPVHCTHCLVLYSGRISVAFQTCVQYIGLKAHNGWRTKEVRFIPHSWPRTNKK